MSIENVKLLAYSCVPSFAVSGQGLPIQFKEKRHQNVQILDCWGYCLYLGYLHNTGLTFYINWLGSRFVKHDRSLWMAQHGRDNFLFNEPWLPTTSPHPRLNMLNSCKLGSWTSVIRYLHVLDQQQSSARPCGLCYTILLADWPYVWSRGLITLILHSLLNLLAYSISVFCAPPPFLYI